MSETYNNLTIIHLPLTIEVLTWRRMLPLCCHSLPLLYLGGALKVQALQRAMWDGARSVVWQ